MDECERVNADLPGKDELDASKADALDGELRVDQRLGREADVELELGLQRGRGVDLVLDYLERVLAVEDVSSIALCAGAGDDSLVVEL